MGSSQKYSLKWNDFSMNVATTFRDLHSRHDFVDVTLACSDGSTLEAHKVILSSVSSYFRDILKVRVPFSAIRTSFISLIFSDNPMQASDYYFERYR